MVHKTVICEFKRVSMSNRQYFSSILEEARLWQQQQGSEGWDYPFDDEWLLPRIRRNELWLGLDGDQPVAAFRVLMEDVPFWGERERGNSIYLHSFAVSRKVAGQGIGNDVISFVRDMGQKQQRQFIRLDCSASSERLIHWYEKQGFYFVDTVIFNRKKMLLMEMPC